MSYGWVTFVENDRGVARSLLLLHSLRASQTAKKVVTILGKDVDQDNVKKLRHYSDYVVPLEHSVSKGIDAGVAAKVQCWSIPGFEKIVFLNSNCVVLRNVDNIFHKYEDGLTFASPAEDTPVFLTKPCFEVYNNLVRSLAGKGNAEGFRQALKAHVSPKPLKEKYCFIMGSGSLQVWKQPAITVVGEVGSLCIREMHDSYRDILGYCSQMMEGVQFMFSNGQPEKPIPDGAPEPIAIIGVSCRFPCSNSLDEFWNFLMSEESGVRPRPQGRWTEAQGCFLDQDSGTREAGWLKGPVDEFDAGFFGMNPMELKSTDPQQRILLEVTYEALEDAGINALELYNKNVGVYMGVWKDDYKELMIESGFKGTEFFRTVMGNSYSASSARISHFLGTTGPNICSEAGCSASFVAINSACTSLRQYETNMCIASAVNLIVHPFTFEDMKSVCSPDCRCKTFDAEANGFARAEGCAAFVLKRYSDACRAGDRIYGLIRGFGITQEGTSKSLGTPTVECESLAMTLALKQAGVSPNEIDYVETHGTGTVVGDKMEINAVARAYKADRSQPLLLGSVKTNIGHAESAAGMAGLAKVLLAFQHETIPPHINVKNLNPLIDFDSIPAKVTLKAETWKRSHNRKRIAGVSNFGITGMDTHLIVEEPPAKIQHCRIKAKSPPELVITVSAKSKEALMQLLKNYRQLFSSNNNLKLNDVALTLNTGRAHYEHRAAVIGNTCASLAESLQRKVYFESAAAPGLKKPRVCFLFAGQGTQYVNMGKELYEISPIFKKHFDYLHSLLLRDYELDIKKAIWGYNNVPVDAAVYSQVGIFVIEVCVAEFWKHLGLQPQVILGHSVGEFAGFVCAGILAVEDALRLVVTRSHLVSKMPPGGMAVVSCSFSETEAVLLEFESAKKEVLDIAASNSAKQTSVAGSITAIEKFIEFCKEQNLSVRRLNSTVAYHSRHLNSILGDLESVANTITYHKPTVTLISSLTAKKVKNITAAYWVRQTRNAVKFYDASKKVLDEAEIFLDIGPHSVLTALLLQNARSLNVPLQNRNFLATLRRHSPEWSTLIHTLAKLYVLGIEIKWRKFHKFYTGEKISLPFYPFQRKKHWLIPNPGNQIGFQRQREFPLIGNKLKGPLKETRITYVNHINLKTVPYVNHHKLGANVVFPGAGYVEMFLEAGRSLGYPAAVKNVRFRAPLVVNAEHNWETHTVFSETEDKARIFCRAPGGEDWVLHAEAELAPNLTPEFTLLRGEILKEELSRLQSIAPVKDTYQTFGELGYNFGTQFQTIISVFQGDGDFLIEVALPEDKGDHVMHPIIIDAVMQSFVVVCTQDFNQLRLPSQIGYFQVVNAEASSPLKYVYIKGQGPDQVIFLLDENHCIVAQMRGMETAASSLDKIQAIIDGKKNKTTPLFIEQFIPGTTLTTISNKFSKYLRTDAVTSASPFMGSDKSAVETLQIAVGFQIMQSLRELGWDALEVGDQITTDSVVRKFGVQTSVRLMQRLLEILEEEGILCFLKAPDHYKVVKLLPGKEELAKCIQVCKTKCDHLKKEWELSEFYLRNLVPCMKGKVNSLELLFPSKGSSTTSAETLYVEAESSRVLNNCIRENFIILLEKAKEIWEDGKMVNIIEVGAGTGSATSVLLPLLEEYGIPYSYTYTDVSSAYFAKAGTKFSKYKKNMIFRPFNVEESPDLQELSPNFYHLLVASNVLHATVNLLETMSHTRALLRKNGLLVLAETFIPQRHYDVTVGHLDGYWRFTDFDLRPIHCTITEPTWRKVLASSGFNVVLSTAVYNGGVGVIAAEATEVSLPRPLPALGGKTWIVFAEKNELTDGVLSNLEFQGRKPILVMPGQSFSYDNTSDSAYIPITSKADINKIMELVGPSALEGVIYMYGLMDNVDATELCLSILYVAQELTKLNCEKPKLYAVTKGVYYIGDQTPVPPSAGAISGLLRSFQTEYPNTLCKIIDIDPEYGQGDKMAETISNELWRNPKETVVSVKDGLVYYGRLKNLKKSFVYQPLSIPKESEFCLELPISKSIADLKFKALTPFPLGEDEVELKIRAIGLNFRDVFIVMKAFDQKTVAVGGDVAGVVTKVGAKCKTFKVGDPVFGARSGNVHLPSCCVMKENQLVRMPDNLTFEEAVTWPVAFTTDYISLVNIAKMKSGDNLLVHAATGAVGLRAVEIGLDVGANIFATAGSKRKREYLKSVGVPAHQIFSSRDTKFAEGILNVLKGPCIDIVLNSITGPGYKEASLSTCAKGARFVELGVMNIWTEEEVKELRPDVAYYAVDLSDKKTQMSDIWANVNKEMNESLNKGSKNIVPVNVFKSEHIRDALTFMQKAKHVGKVVCTMPRAVGLTESPIFNERSTYLITGGLGGIGLKVAEWMLSKGAKNLVLSSRSKPSREHEEIVLNFKNAFPGANILNRELDVSSFQDCSKNLQFIKDNNDLPPLRGIMHAAGTLSDGRFLEQNEEKFNHVLKSKLKGCWNFHLLTKETYALEHFVMFSSFAAVIGTPGQANHAASNSFMDSLAAYRHSCGLPGTSINWGQWGEVGIVANARIRAYNPMSTADCLGSLELVLTSQQLNAVAVDGEISKWRTLFPWTNTYFELLEDGKSQAAQNSASNLTSESFWKKVDEVKEDQGKLSDFVKNATISTLSALLHQPPEEINQDQDLGLDSLMFIELRNSFQTLLGKRATIPNNAFDNIRKFGKIAERFEDIVKGRIALDTAEKNKKKLLGPKESCESHVELIREDGQLCPELKAQGKFSVPMHKPSEIRNVLLTGVTGNLGPYVLKDLTKNPQIHVVYCLIRAKNEDLGYGKIMKYLHHMNLLEDVDMSKVVAVVGNLALPRLGMADSNYEELSTKIDGVVNLAAYVNHIEGYEKTELGIPSLRNVNVLGLQELLKFTVNKKTKHFFHGSSLICLMKSRPGTKNNAPEEWVDFDEYDNAPNIGYSISKFIGEKILEEAVNEKGIPCKCFRFPLISGNSQTGRQNVTKSHFFLKYVSFLKAGIMPNVDTPAPLLPVDICSDISLRIFLNDEAAPGVYNVVNPHVVSELDLVQIAPKFGFSLKAVEYSEFVEFLNKSDGLLIGPLKEFYTDPQRFLAAMKEMTILEDWRKNRKEYFLSKKVLKHVPDLKELCGDPMITWERDMKYALKIIQ